MAVTWTTDLTEHLIALFEAYPLLYDIKDKTYFNRDKKKKAHEEIAAELNISVSDVAKKLKSLRTQYLREKRTSQDTKSGQGVEDTQDKNKWQYFKCLAFLDQFTKPRDTITNLKADNEDEECIEIPSEDESTSSENKRPLNAAESKGKKKKKLRAEDSLLEEAIVCMRKGNEETTTLGDEDDIFGKFVASDLKAIQDQHLKRKVKWQIQTALYESHSVLMTGMPSTQWPTVPTHGQPSPQYQSFSPGPSSQFQPIAIHPRYYQHPGADSRPSTSNSGPLEHTNSPK